MSTGTNIEFERKAHDSYLWYNTVSETLRVHPVHTLDWQRSAETAWVGNLAEYNSCRVKYTGDGWTEVMPGSHLPGFLPYTLEELKTFPPGHENRKWEVIKVNRLAAKEARFDGSTQYAVDSWFTCKEVPVSSEKSDEKTMPSAVKLDDVKDPAVDTKS